MWTKAIARNTPPENVFARPSAWVLFLNFLYFNGIRADAVATINIMIIKTILTVLPEIGYFYISSTPISLIWSYVGAGLFT